MDLLSISLLGQNRKDAEEGEIHQSYDLPFSFLFLLAWVSASFEAQGDDKLEDVRFSRYYALQPSQMTCENGDKPCVIKQKLYHQADDCFNLL
jgi:hypothetical protein